MSPLSCHPRPSRLANPAPLVVTPAPLVVTPAPLVVTPAKAGAQGHIQDLANGNTVTPAMHGVLPWTPVFTGVTGKRTGITVRENEGDDEEDLRSDTL